MSVAATHTVSGRYLPAVSGSDGAPGPGLSPDALRAALWDLAEFGVVYLDSAGDAKAVAHAAPTPVHASVVRGRWRLEEVRRAG